MDTFNIGQLTKEMVAKRLSEIEDPLVVASEVLEKSLGAALAKSTEFGEAERATVAEVCHGALTGILLREQDLARGAVLILAGAISVCRRQDFEPSEFLGCAVEGLARIRVVATIEQLEQVASALENAYMGAGCLFRTECAKASDAQRTRGRA